MTRSQPNSNLAEFDPEIERSLLHTWQARRRLDYTASASTSLEEPSETLDEIESDLESTTSYSSAGTTDTSLHPTGENHMAEPHRITLHEQGVPDLILQPLQANPIRHLRNFQVACSTARRHGTDEIAIMVFVFPFSLEGSIKEWFYSQPDEVVTEWDLLRREFLDKFFPPEKTNYIWKKSSDTHLLISYFNRGLCAADKRLLTTSSGGSLSKNKTAAEAWSVINDVVEAIQHVRVRNNPPKSVVETPSESALTKVLGDMTTILTEIRKEQKAFQSIQAIQAPPQILQLEGPHRVCGLCSSTAHYTDQCHQVQEDYTLAVANVNYNNRPPYQSQGQNNYSHGNSSNQGWRDNAQGNNHNQRWNQGNSSSHYHNNNQSSSQYHNNNHQANQNHHNQPYQHSQQN
ncbi:hypothetical protein AHAS_Ahas11G0177200 [Arachis hypogaea]